MDPVFDTVGDAMSKKLFRHRKKFIHSVGPVAKVKFIAESGSSYDGIFQGADYGIIRFSSAAKPSENGIPLSPGFGLKFLRDGIDSANLVAAAFSENGESQDWNFFSNSFSNWVSPSQEGIAAWTV